MSQDQFRIIATFMQKSDKSPINMRSCHRAGRIGFRNVLCCSYQKYSYFSYFFLQTSDGINGEIYFFCKPAAHFRPSTKREAFKTFKCADVNIANNKYFFNNQQIVRRAFRAFLFTPSMSEC